MDRCSSGYVIAGLGLALAMGQADFALAQSAAPAPAVVTVSARWSGDAPRSVTVQTLSVNETLALDQAAGQFKGPVSVDRPISDADLLVSYPDNTEVSLPLRLSAGTPNVALSVKRPGGVKCNKQTVDQLSTPVASLIDAVHNYLAAKAINQITGDNRCGSLLRPKAAKAWFDTSYALVTMRPFFRLDPGARAAYASVKPRNLQVLAIYQDQADAAHAAALYNQSLALFEAGQAAGALQVNTELRAALQSDHSLAKAAKELQGITSGKLAADSALFESVAQMTPPT